MPELHFFERRADPPPAKVNAITLTVTFTTLWILATAVIGVLDLMGRVPGNWLDVCFAGLGMGLLAVCWGYVHEYRAARRQRR
ncbi:DUF2530 domain-containing protein [Georgenia sp. EYE_87]|uniref:DUF2530 domain-containing protein n=1 Tax=Georgenia sp. EYE_87 TaxID=2853448 RepID=UPI002006A517|nr:DUF2530 domain-containing protein [Georgenia sp. EYE_87]MCK6210845.1 DUF2530 domain-containing protein [Georgenia sp. EYE_87]